MHNPLSSTASKHLAVGSRRKAPCLLNLLPKEAGLEHRSGFPAWSPSEGFKVLRRVRQQPWLIGHFPKCNTQCVFLMKKEETPQDGHLSQGNLSDCDDRKGPQSVDITIKSYPDDETSQGIEDLTFSLVTTQLGGFLRVRHKSLGRPSMCNFLVGLKFLCC